MPTAPFKVYRSFPTKLANKEIDLSAGQDALHVTLHTSTYTPNLDTHAYVSSLTGELAAGAGYSTGGVTMGSQVLAQTAANSWAQVAAVSTAYAVGDTRRPATGNGFVYRCVVAGTSSGTAPTWPTVIGTTVTDGTVTWACMGGSVTSLDAADPTWPTATFTGVRYAVISDRTPGTAAAQPLIAIADFGSDQAGGGGDFAVVIDAAGFLLGFPLS